MIKINCQICNTEFWGRPRAKFCSRPCYGKSKLGSTSWNSGIKTGLAPWLGKKRDAATTEKMRQSKLASGYSHPPEIRASISRKMLGVSKGGVSSISALIRGCTVYKQWRVSIFRRDNYTCQECGQHGVKLNADHKIKFSHLLKKFKISDLPSAISCSALWDLSNGRTLCVCCHAKTPTFGNRI